MKKIIILILAIAAAVNVFGTNKYPFEVTVSGKSKNVMLLIPGLSCSGKVWDETVAHYKDKYTCHVLTFHGFAGVAADSSTSFRGWEEAIAKYITEQKLGKVTIVGHSIGGGMAMLLASGHPELVERIVVVDALPALGALTMPGFQAQENPDCSPMIQRFTSMSNEQFAQMQKNTMPTLMQDTVHRQEAIGWSLSSDRKAVAEIYCQFLNLDQRSTVKNITCPALILLEAPFSEMKTAVEEQFSGIKNAKFSYSGKGLHFLMYDDAKWYFSETDAFLR